MIVYHGSNQVVKSPDVNHSYRNLDFGKGFYVTTVKAQATRWALRKADLVESGRAILNVYEMAGATSNLACKAFGNDLESWIDFVCDCRDGAPVYQKYDLISGKVANDKVYRVVDMYHAGIWDKERAIREIRAYQNYDQIAFVTQRAIDQLLTFKLSEEL